MPVATRRELLEAGVHFGHQTRRWNPKMRRYIFGERSGIYIIDLEKTLAALGETYDFLADIGRQGGTVLFVGTKKQAQETVAEQAGRVGMPFVNTRWLGGMLTNFQTIHGRLQRMKELREMERSGAFDFLPKKEVLKLRHEKDKLERNLSGIQDMERLPNAIFVIDTKREHIAVKEARKLGIPIIAIVDTNCDPDEADYIIPGNDDAIRACSLIAKVVADAVQEGHYMAYKSMQTRAAEPEFTKEPVPASAPPEPAPDDAKRSVQLSEEEAAFFGATLDEEARQEVASAGAEEPAEEAVGSGPTESGAAGPTDAPEAPAGGAPQPEPAEASEPESETVQSADRVGADGPEPGEQVEAAGPEPAEEVGADGSEPGGSSDAGGAAESS
jgi:small subunit ribosomal protein S2